MVRAAAAVTGTPGYLVHTAGGYCATRTAARLATASPILSLLIKDGKLKVVAARYDLAEGKVEYLS
jgi:carbonic anhydrase